MNVFLTIVHIFGLVTLCFSALMSTCWVTSELTNDAYALASLCQQLHIDLSNSAIKLDQISIDLLNYR